MRNGFPRMPERFSNHDGKSRSRARVVAFGDSLTAGWYCKGSKFEPYAKALLKSLPPEIAVDIFVCGLSGYTAGQMVDSMDKDNLRDHAGRTGKGLRRILREEGPVDLAIVMAGTNDCGTQAHPDDVVSAVKQLHVACHEAGTKTVMLTVPESRQMCEIFTARDRREAVNSRLKKWAKRQPNVQAVVETGKLVPWSASSEHWENDGLHFSKLGSRHLGVQLATCLASVLESSDLRMWQTPTAGAFASIATDAPQSEFDIGCHVDLPAFAESPRGIRSPRSVAYVGQSRHDDDEDDFIVGCSVGVPMLSSPPRRGGGSEPICMGACGGIHKLLESGDMNPRAIPQQPAVAGKPGLPHYDEQCAVDSDDDFPHITCHGSSTTAKHSLYRNAVVDPPSPQKGQNDTGAYANVLQRLASWMMGAPELPPSFQSQVLQPEAKVASLPQAPPAANALFRVGDAVDYWSEAGKWVRCSITAVSTEGKVAIDIRPGRWLNDTTQKMRLRSSARTACRNPGPMTARGHLGVWQPQPAVFA